MTDIEGNFITLWNFRSDAEFGGADKIAPLPRPANAGIQSIQIVKSLPPRVPPIYEMANLAY